MNYKTLKQFVKQGGQGTSARLCIAIGSKASDMSDWVHGKRPIPMRRALAIETETVGVVPRWLTRPADWHLLWPELMEHADAPAVLPEAA